MCSMYDKGRHATRPKIYNTTKAHDSGSRRPCRLPHSGCMPASLRDGRLFHSTLDACLTRRSTPTSLTGTAPRSINEADSPLRTSTARPEPARAEDARTEEDMRSRERERAGTKRSLNARKREQTIPKARQPDPKCQNAKERVPKEREDRRKESPNEKEPKVP